MSRKLSRRAKDLLSKESGTVFKPEGGRVRVCLVYPNTYHVGMSSLGFQGVYTLLNERDDTYCERAFLPESGDMEEHWRTGTELFSLETGRPLGRFDIIAFSVSFENDYPHVLRILELANIPVEAGERTELHPLIVMGGVSAFSNPEPMAPFLDVVFVGEAEEMLHEFMDAFVRASTREEVFERAAGMEGVYLPSFYEVRYGSDGLISGRVSRGPAPDMIKRRWVRDLSERPMRPLIVTPETEFSRMYLIEAQRGCPWSCNFCLAGHVFNPPRRKAPEALAAEVREARERTERVGLIGPSLSDYPGMEGILSLEGVDFSITSLRASRKSAVLLEHLKGRKSVSIAPEAGTRRLRDVIHKGITDEDIMEAAGLIFEHRVERLRLYFMVGLPTETEEDVEGIVELVSSIRKASRRGKLVLTLSTFVPKPFTPFQWRPMERMETVKKRLNVVKRGLQKTKDVSVFHDVPKYAYMQGLFSLGDRRVARVLKSMLIEEDWRRAAGQADVDLDFHIFRQKTLAEDFPWDFIDAGVDKGRLWNAFEGKGAGK
jgi:radical SAM superfamily enzyme YgiQ (UPF0313 family)